VWIEYETLLQNSKDSSDVLFGKIKQLIFVDVCPDESLDEETADKILWFYCCGKELSKDSGTGSKQIFSYEFDDTFIYAAFKEQYNIDLESANLHWWKFIALMNSLSDSTMLVKIMGYRAVAISSKMSAEQRNFYAKMKKQYAIPESKEIKEHNNAIETALLNGEPIDNLL
jgi:hypothetical protein